MAWPKYLPLPDKRICDLTARQTETFRAWMGLNQTGVPSEAVPEATADERKARERRERWKRRFAGKGKREPSLLIRKEQISRLQKNAKIDSTARNHRDGIIGDAETVVSLPRGFFHSFIPDMGPWNPGGNFCPNCIHQKSPEGINNYFWEWDWQDPEKLTCPYCQMAFPNATYHDNANLILPRLGLTYRIHVREAEWASSDWRLGDKAERFVEQPIHISFSGNIRANRINWSIGRLKSLGLAYAITKDKRYVRSLTEILERFADVYHRYPLQSYFQDVVDADPGFAVDNADNLPTVFKRNACIGVYDGRFGYNHEKTTTREARVATGLWGSSRIAREITTTGNAFLTAFQGYDLAKSAISVEKRTDIEQRFLLELYMDIRAYENITNKAGNVRASRAAFGQAYGNATETRAGVKGFHDILGGQFHKDGSFKETPIYGHKPIGENLWQIPEILRGEMDLYSDSLIEPAFGAFAKIQTPWASYPTHDDSFVVGGVPVPTFDVALERCGIHIPGQAGPPSEFALYNSDLSKRPKRRASPGKALNHYFQGRHLACVGFGTGRQSTQLYLLGEDGCRIHRHAAPLNLQLYTHGWEVFPDLGYICDHPGNQWVKATASHQTVTIDEANSYGASSQSELLALNVEGDWRTIHKQLTLPDGQRFRRAVALWKKPDGWPVLIDVFEVEGGTTHDYQARVDAPRSQFKVAPALGPRRKRLYQEHSFYPIENFRTAGKLASPARVTWGHGDRRLQATVLSRASELLTYQSPGWRSQYEITDQPDKYFNTAVLRNRSRKSRFIVIYEAGPKSAVSASLDAETEFLRLTVKGSNGWTVELPQAAGQTDFRIDRR